MISVSAFEELRPYLFSLAYRLLGSASEAEDVLQDAWLRTHKAPEIVGSERAWLSTVVTRLCLDRLKSARAAREEYVGPWLPEPVQTEAVAAPESEVLRKESVTVAFLVLLETLSPAERAAFLLREIFDYSYSEVAQILDASEASVRQLVHRSKERIVQGRRRFQPDAGKQKEIVTRFLSAIQEGDVTSLESLLASDAMYAADGGGKVVAAKRVVQGAQAVARVFAGLYQIASSSPDKWRSEIGEVNCELALLAYFEGRLDTVFVFSTDDDQIQSIHAIRNPSKLTWLKRHLQAS